MNLRKFIAESKPESYQPTSSPMTMEAMNSIINDIIDYRLDTQPEKRAKQTKEVKPKNKGIKPSTIKR